MPAPSLALLNGHHHTLPDSGAISAVLDHTESQVAAERVIDTGPVAVALAAVGARCGTCQRRVSGWFAAHGDPWAIVRLAGPVAADAYRLVRRCRAAATTGVTELVRRTLSAAFGPDVAEVAAPVAPGGDLGIAVARLRTMTRTRRHVVVDGVLDGLANPLTPALIELVAPRLVWYLRCLPERRVAG